MTLDGEQKTSLNITNISCSSILELFELRKELGLKDNYIMHPLRDEMFIQREKQIMGKWLYAESNCYVFDIYSTWLVLDDLVERLNVQQNLQSQAML